MAKIVNAIEPLVKKRESIAKLFRKNLVIAQSFQKMADYSLAATYFREAHLFAQQIWQIDSQLKAAKAI